MKQIFKSDNSSLSLSSKNTKIENTVGVKDIGVPFNTHSYVLRVKPFSFLYARLGVGMFSIYAGVYFFYIFQLGFHSCNSIEAGEKVLLHNRPLPKSDL